MFQQILLFNCKILNLSRTLSQHSCQLVKGNSDSYNNTPWLSHLLWLWRPLFPFWFGVWSGAGYTTLTMALIGYHSSVLSLAPICLLVPAHVITSHMALISCFLLSFSFSLVSLIPFDFLWFIVQLFWDPKLVSALQPLPVVSYKRMYASLPIP